MKKIPNLLLGCLLLGIAGTAWGGIIYVDGDANAANNGSSWEDAFNYLQDALAAATSGDQIWVAEGIYRPDENTANPTGTNDRTATFQLINGVTIKGGYAGFGEPDPDGWDVELYETILSGDLNGDDIPVASPSDLLTEPTRTDNSYTIVTGSATDLTAVIDGFTISGGIAIRPTPGHVPDICGGGMYNSGGSPTVSNCTFRENAAAYRGGGMDNVYSSNPHVSNCTFIRNTAGDEGGGIENNYASSPTVRNCIFTGNSAFNCGGGMNNDNPGTNPTVSNCIFSGNSALGLGGGMRYALGCSPILTNCTFSHNTAGVSGNGINGIRNASGTTMVTNCIFWDGGDEIVIDSSGSVTVNYSNVQGGWSGPGTGNIDADPCFVDANGPDGIAGTEDDNLRLLPDSPCIDAGDNSAVPPAVTEDLDGNPRIMGLAVDMGAYEFQPCWQEQTKLLASDGAAGDSFGMSVSISGDFAILGADADDDNGDHSGSAYIFKWDGSGWVQQQKLSASDGAAGDGFGMSVSISGDYAIVGAEGDDDNGEHSGSAYIFKWDGTSWVEQQKLLASDGTADDRFGFSVSISGDLAIVGAYYDDNINGTDSGSAYIFRRSYVPNDPNWYEQTKLIPYDGGAGDRFGRPVSISGDYAIVGAIWDDNYTGSAYIFTPNDVDPNNWDEIAKLTASDGAASDRFSYSVSINGDYAIVGAEGDDDNGTGSGSAYIFKWDGTSWSEQQKLLASDGVMYDNFGQSVSISGNLAIVGAFLDDNFTGSAYIFKWDGTSWVQQQKLAASDGVASDYFGVSVSISGDTAIVGAYGDDDNGTGSGSAYVFKNICAPTAISVALDIKPQSCPNPLNVDSKGKLPVAILGTEDFDVNQIDIASIRLEGVAPIRSSFEDVATPVSDGNECDCNTIGPDAYTDLTLKFKTQEIVEELLKAGDQLVEGEQLTLSLTGELADETAIEGADCMVIVGNVPKFTAAKIADVNGDGIVNMLDMAMLAKSWLDSSVEE